MKERIVAIIGLNFVLLLLFGGFCLYAETLSKGGSGEIIPSFEYINVVGDKEKYAEDHWIQKGGAGGVGDYVYIDENSKGDSVIVEGRAIAGNDDYLFDMDLKKEGFGNFIFEFKQFKKYYDGSGGFYSQFNPTGAIPKIDFVSDRDLFLNIGDFKIEGIFSKDNITKCDISYGREYRKGAKSLISWGPVLGNGYTKYVLPTFLETNEIVDRLKLRLDHTVNDIEISAEQEWEKSKIEIQKVNNRRLTLTTGVYDNVRIKYEDLDSDSYTTIIRASKEVNERLSLNSSFLYNHYRGHTLETVTDTSTANTNENNPHNPANVYQDIVTILPKVSMLPWEHLPVDVGAKYDWIKKDGAANYDRNKTFQTAPTPNGYEVLVIKDEIVENKLSEFINLKYDGISNVVLYADGELAQEIRYENNTQNSSGLATTNSNNFYRDTDTLSYDYEYVLGSKFYPMSRVDLTAELRYRYGIRDYNIATKDVRSGDITNGYRAFIESMSYTSYKPMVMLNLKPLKWATCSFRYGLETTTYGTLTRVSGTTELAKYLANIYSVGATIMPCEPLYLSLFYQYKEASTLTQAKGGNVVIQPIYNANVKSLTASCNYSPCKNSKIIGTYSFSRADNFDDFSNIGLPLGLDNFSQNVSIALEKDIAKDLSLEFKYELGQYDEKSNNGIDDYIGHLFYTALKAVF